MNEEDEAFNEIERRSIAKKDAVKAQLDKPQRTWVGLTEEERREIWNVGEKKDQALRALLIQTIRDIEAKLKEKNT